MSAPPLKPWKFGDHAAQRSLARYGTRLTWKEREELLRYIRDGAGILESFGIEGRAIYQILFKQRLWRVVTDFWSYYLITALPL